MSKSIHKKKENITNYSDNELSNLVYNIEYLYLSRHNITYLMELINDVYIYTENQKEILLHDINI